MSSLQDAKIAFEWTAKKFNEVKFSNETEEYYEREKAFDKARVIFEDKVKAFIKENR